MVWWCTQRFRRSSCEKKRNFIFDLLLFADWHTVVFMHLIFKTISGFFLVLELHSVCVCECVELKFFFLLIFKNQRTKKSRFLCVDWELGTNDRPILVTSSFNNILFAKSRWCYLWFEYIYYDCLLPYTVVSEKSGSSNCRLQQWLQ